MTGLTLEGVNSTFNDLDRELQALKDLATGTARDTAIIDLREKIFAARTALLAALQEINSLKRKATGFEDWKRDSERYQAQQFEPGTIVYVLKDELRTGQPTRYFCPNCYANKKVRFLQPTPKTSMRRRVRVCLECTAELAFGPPEHMASPRMMDDDYDAIGTYR